MANENESTRDIAPSEAVLLYADQFTTVTKIKAKIWVMILSFCGALLGLFIMIQCSADAIAANKAKKWPHVNGRITHIGSTLKPKSRGNVSNEIQVSYIYKIEGPDSLEGHLLYLSKVFNDYSDDEVSKIKAQFPQGSIVPVYYNRDEPKKAFLLTGATQATYIMIPVGYLLIIGLGYIFIRQIKMYRQK